MNITEQSVKTLLIRGSKLFIAILLLATITPQILNTKLVSADDGGYPWIGATTLDASTGDFGYMSKMDC
jgi:hypothetical protein